MANITICTSNNCPYRNTCYKIKAKPSESQSYSNFEYSCNENSGFEDYIVNNENEVIAWKPKPELYKENKI